MKYLKWSICLTVISAVATMILIPINDKLATIASRIFLISTIPFGLSLIYLVMKYKKPYSNTHTAYSPDYRQKTNKENVSTTFSPKLSDLPAETECDNSIDDRHNNCCNSDTSFHRLFSPTSIFSRIIKRLTTISKQNGNLSTFSPDILPIYSTCLILSAVHCILVNDYARGEIYRAGG